MSSRNAFFFPPQVFRDGFVTVTDKDVVHQIRRVLRLRVGDAFIALDGRGHASECLIHSMEKDTLRAQIVAERTIDHEPTAAIVLYPALIRRERFALLLEKCTELGVTEFRPIIAERSAYTHLTPILLRRWEKVVREAAEVVRRGVLPAIHQAQPVAEALAGLSMQEGDRAFILSTRSEEMVLPKDLVAICAKKPQRIHLFLGPEGDCTDAEYALFRDAGIQPLSLGSRIVRSETAAIAAVSLLAAFL